MFPKLSRRLGGYGKVEAVPLEIVLEKKLQSRSHLDFWRRQLRE